jgi:hypothetical protein
LVFDFEAKPSCSPQIAWKRYTRRIEVSQRIRVLTGVNADKTANAQSIIGGIESAENWVSPTGKEGN